MDKQLFDELVQSLKQAKAISKGKAKASRRFKVESTDVKAIRNKRGQTTNSARGQLPS